MRLAWPALLLCSCATLTGIDDLELGQRPGSVAPDDAGEDLTPDAASPDAPAPPPDAGLPPPDSGIDSPPPVCTLPANEKFVAAAPKWITRGVAAYANPGMRLTPNEASMTGTVWWDEPRTFDRFDIVLSYKITSTGLGVGPGDGLALAWISAQAVPPLGGTGGGMGIEGLPGWAVAVDVYQNAEFTDPAVPAIMIKKTDDMTNLASAPVNAALIDGNEHTVRVRLASGSVTVALDGTDVLGPTAIPAYTPYSGYFGFGAGTGGAISEHLLTSVTAKIGTSGPCAAP